jgi:hypothetical protein
MAKNSTEEFSHSGGEGKKEEGMGLGAFKSKADPIAHGLAGSSGCSADAKKIKSQMKSYHGH